MYPYSRRLSRKTPIVANNQRKNEVFRNSALRACAGKASATIGIDHTMTRGEHRILEPFQQQTQLSIPRRRFITTLGAAVLASCDAPSQITIPLSSERDACEVVWSQDRVREGNPMKAYEDDFLRERELIDTPGNRETARHRVLELRSMFQNATVFRSRTLVGLGADMLCNSDRRMFYNPRQIRRLEEYSDVQIFDGVPPNGKPTRELITGARDALLHAISETEGLISGLFKVHGSVDALMFGYGGSPDTEETPRVTLTRQQLADAILPRLAPEGPHQYSETEPETFTFDACGSGGLGKQTLKTIQRARAERGWNRPISVVAISSTTGADFGFNDALTDLELSDPSFQTLYENENSIGPNMLQRSNPEMHVIDPDTGHPTKIV